MKTGTLREDESRRLSNQDFPSPESTVREIAGLVPKIKTIVFDQEVIIGSGVSDETNIVIDDSQIHSRKRNEICISLRQCKCPSQRLFESSGSSSKDGLFFGALQQLLVNPIVCVT